jgi:competence protein ComEC
MAEAHIHVLIPRFFNVNYYLIMKLADRLQLYPLLRVAVFLGLGIVAGSYLLAYVSAEAWLWAALVALVLACLAGRSAVLQGAIILSAAFLMGCFLISNAEERYRIMPDREPMAYEAVVVSQPVEKGKTIRFDMLITDGRLCGRKVRASVLKDTADRRYSRLRIGMGIAACSRMERPASFGTSHFDYAAYLKTQGVSAQTFIFHDQWEQVSVSLERLSVWERFKLAALGWRMQFVDRYRSLGFDGQALAVIAAMTLGDKSAVSKDVMAAYRESGAAHVLALSGLHLSIIYLVFVVLSAPFRFSVLREVLLLAAVWSYVVMVGLMPSVVRAATMVTVYSLAGLAGRSRMSLSTLAFTALLMLVAEPFCLFDVGFQLSFMAVFFILLYHRAVSRLVPAKFQQQHRIFRYVWQLTVISFIAQLGTAPLAAYYFGRLPVYFLLTNLVVIPAASIILYLSVAVLAFTALPSVQYWLVAVLAAIVDALNRVLAHIASWPFSGIDGIHVNKVQVVCCYFVLFAFSAALYILQRSAPQTVEPYRRE